MIDIPPNVRPTGYPIRIKIISIRKCDQKYRTKQEIEIDTRTDEERLKREEENSQADLILLVDAARITNAAKANLLQKIESKSLENDVPTGLKDPDKEWYALTRRVRVMVANPKIVDVSKIKDYTDLADPAL